MERIHAENIILIVLTIFLSKEGFGQSVSDNVVAQDHKFLSYGSKGFVFSDLSGDYLMNMEFRGQFRLSYPTDNDRVTMDDYQDEQVKLLNLNYWISAFMGTGRGSKENDDKHLMYPSKQLKKLETHERDHHTFC